MNTSEPTDTEGLIERLAAIEHERWSDWQNWVHIVFLEGNFREFMLRWQKQIVTPYAELTEAEKQSDRDQVMRYYPLIERYIDPSPAIERARLEEAKLARKQYINDPDFIFANGKRIEQLQATLDKLDKEQK